MPDFSRIFSKVTNNPFEPITSQERKKMRKREEEIKKEINELILESRALFQDERYLKLREKFQDIYQQNLKDMIDYEEPTGNISNYAFKMRKFQTQLRTLKLIFDTPKEYIDIGERNEAKRNAAQT